MPMKDITSKGSGSSKTYAGSQLQIQTYVNSRSNEIDVAIQGKFPELVGAAFQWRSPLAHEQYREYWDRAFLAVVDQERHWPTLKQFWPRGGPHWDALAVVVQDGRAPGVLLVEAKSYVDGAVERRSDRQGCGQGLTPPDRAGDGMDAGDRRVVWSNRSGLVRHAAVSVSESPRAPAVVQLSWC